MRDRPDRDRLAICTYEEAGEQIPIGDPSVTDAERAAAGRETLAERFAAVLPDNRKRAAGTRNGSAATARSGGSSSFRSHWAGCCGLRAA